MHSLHANIAEGFRSRTGSNASSYGRLSPFEEHAATPNYSPHPWLIDYDYSGQRNGQVLPETKVELAELDSMAHSMRLGDGSLCMDPHNLNTSTTTTNQPQRTASGLNAYYQNWTQNQTFPGEMKGSTVSGSSLTAAGKDNFCYNCDIQFNSPPYTIRFNSPPQKHISYHFKAAEAQ